MAGALFRQQSLFEFFEWTTDDAAVLAAGRAKILERRLAAGGHKTAIDWDDLTQLPAGVRLRWRTPCKYPAGYQWFTRVLGDLVPL